MLRPAPDVEALRAELARELATVMPGPGGWARVRASLEAGSRRRRSSVPTLAIAVATAVALMAALAAISEMGSRSPGGGEVAVSGPAPLASLCGAVAAVAAPVSCATFRRPTRSRR